jgi:hypothetical protein
LVVATATRTPTICVFDLKIAFCYRRFLLKGLIQPSPAVLWLLKGEVKVIMTIMKGKVLSIIALVFLASSITIASASTTKTPFYLKALATTMNVEWSHQADDSLGIMKLTEGGIVRDAQDQEVGTFAFDLIETISMKTGRGTASGHFAINFNSGATIEGTITAKIQMYIGTYLPPDVDGKFVGHGDMHVMGDLYLMIEGANAFIVFDGYSW